ncbi:MAG TPA: flagellar biosynthetic protein FliR [Verrucomicrobiae bacterium]|nr:flagellar biosynthetic protein FliR [Verrucomicrobiae bacterium]
MGGNLTLSISTLLGFLLTLVRISGVFIFIPIPGATAVVNPGRVIFALATTIALFPLWPQVRADASIGLFVMWILMEAALGVGIGLAVAFLMESFALGAQVLGMQAGYSFAQMVDPNTQADSGVMPIFAQLTAGLMFFSTGLDRDVLHVFARSLETCPAGTFVLSRGAAEQLLAMGSAMFSTALRLALPVIAVMVMVDISLALLGRVNAQLQLLHLAFPMKMMVALAMLGWIAVMIPALFHAGASGALTAAMRLVAK